MSRLSRCMVIALVCLACLSNRAWAQSPPTAAAAIKAKGMEPLGADRMPPIAADQRTDAQKKAVEEFKTARGVELSGPFHPLLRSPELMTRTRAMGDYLRYNSVLPPRLSEFVILLTAREWTQQYEWNAHHQIALKAGLDPQVVQAVAEGRRPMSMSDDEALLYGFCLELQRTKSISEQGLTPPLLPLAPRR